MREIKFRGRREHKSEWIYGYMTIHPDGRASITKDGYCLYFVDRETIGQYTGLKDKNGVEIYEGDICKYDDEEDTATFIVKYEFGKFVKAWHEWPSGTPYLPFDPVDMKIIIVIGNIYENPELLESKNG